MDENYADNLKIDINALEEEWLNQPRLYAKYSKIKAEAKADMDRAAEKVKTVRSELILEARKGGKDLLGFNPTDSSIEAWYRTQKKWLNAREEYIDAEYEYNILDGAVFAFSQRKYALENLVSLWIGNYYSSPRENSRKNIKEKVVNAEDDRQREFLNKKRESK